MQSVYSTAPADRVRHILEQASKSIVIYVNLEGKGSRVLSIYIYIYIYIYNEKDNEQNDRGKVDCPLKGNSLINNVRYEVNVKKEEAIDKDEKTHSSATELIWKKKSVTMNVVSPFQLLLLSKNVVSSGSNLLWLSLEKFTLKLKSHFRI